MPVVTRRTFGADPTDYSATSMLAGDGALTGRAWPAGIAAQVDELAGLAVRDADFSTVPGFVDGTITYPDAVTANHQQDVTIPVAGILRIAGHASNTSNNLRRAYGLTAAGILGDSEVRSTISGSSFDFTTGVGGDARFQFGHVHRYTRTREVLQAPTPCTASSSTTVGVTGTPWATNQWIGLAQSLREVWVQIVAGDGTGQKRRVISNTAGALTVDHAWTTTPWASATGGGHTQSQFEIYTYQVRALSIVIGNVAGGGHNMVQPNIWDGGAFRQPGIGQQALADASTPSGAYLLPLGSFGGYRAFPWHMKSRCIGNTLDIAVWADPDPETAYGTSGRSFSWTLGAGDDYGYAEEPGYSGLYMGHLNAGDYMEWSSLQVSAA